ncbi:MAG: GntR family transcriptional regulator [Thermoanaerobaculia bacterium]|nr:GntR family transcriptional regulator [Thermoanaerobaculia bacterium]
MELILDIDESTPLFTQLIEQVKRAVQSGALRPGDPLPSIRQLANDLDVNKKTVAKAYRLLERDSVLQTKGYRGTFVHPDAEANCQVDLSASIEKTLRETVAKLRAEGATDSEIRIAFGEVMSHRSDRSLP